MARVKVKLQDAIARVVFIETDATIGATIGRDLKLPDGTVATQSTLRDYLGVEDTEAGVSHHRLLQGLALGDDHTQYTRKDTLSARGDLYTRDASTVIRLGLGAPTQLLRVGSSGLDPEWYDGDANPSAQVGLTAVNGTAATFLRSDAAPALSQSITPTWTGVHTFSNQIALTGKLSVDGDEGTLGQCLTSAGPGATPTWTTVSGGGGSTISRGATFASGSGALSAGVGDVHVRIPTSGTIHKVTLMTRGGTGSCVLDIWKDTYANYPPTVGDSICAAAKPTISSGVKYEDATLTGWTTSVTAGDVLVFHVDSTSVFTAIFIQLDIS